MKINKIRAVSKIDLEEATPFIIRKYTENSEPIIQMIKNPVGFRKTERLILSDPSLVDYVWDRSKQYIRIEDVITDVIVKIKGNDMEIFFSTLKKLKKK